jgi:hypothetical protein
MDETQVVEGLGKGHITYSQNLMIQINRVAVRASEALGHDEHAMDAFKNSIKIFERMMRPYMTDTDFKKKKLDIMRRSKPADKITQPDEWFDLFGELVLLLEDSGLLPYEDAEIYDGIDFND